MNHVVLFFLKNCFYFQLLKFKQKKQFSKKNSVFSGKSNPDCSKKLMTGWILRHFGF